MKKKFLITTNFALSPEMKLAKDFEKHMGMPMEIFSKDSSGKKNNSTYYRHYTYFYTALKAFYHRNKYEYIIFWTQFSGLYYGLLTRIFFFLPAKPTCIVLALMYVKRDGLAGKIYHRIFSYMLDAKANKFAVCAAKSERDYIEEVLKPKRIQILFTRDGEGEYIEDKPDKNVEQYFFSGGGSLRDYKTLVRAFSRMEHKLKIACGPGHVKNISIPDNVEIIYNAWGNEFDKLILNSYAVIIILEDTRASAGQLVLIRGMKKGKATIVTNGDNLNDYIDPTYSLTVNFYSEDEIIEKVNALIADNKLTESMGVAALNNYKKTYTEEKYVQRICKILKQEL